MLGAMPVLAAIATAIMWVDTRYMHREISDTRFIELQLRIVQAQVREYHRRVEDGKTLTPDELLQFELDKDQLKFLMNERNRLLGLGEDE